MDYDCKGHKGRKTGKETVAKFKWIWKMERENKSWKNIYEVGIDKIWWLAGSEQEWLSSSASLRGE